MRKRILLLSPQPFFQWRGSPIRVKYNLEALSQLGYEVDLLTFPFGEDVSISNVQIYRVAPCRFCKSIPIGPSFWKLFFDVRLYRAARQKLKQQKYDLIHGVEEAGFLAVRLARRAGVPVIYEKHSDPASYRKNALVNGLLSFYARVERYTVRRASTVIATGEGLKAQVKTYSPITPCTHIFDIPSSFRQASNKETRTLREELGSGESDVVATYVGSFAVYQGINLLFHALPEALKKEPRLRVWIIGGSEEEIVLRKQAMQKAGLGDRVRFLGKISPDQLSLYLGASNILLSPRIAGNNTPLKVLDYLHAGRAILATDVESNRLLLDDRVAAFSKPDASSFAWALARLAGDDGQRERLSRTGRSLIDAKYNFEQYKKQIHEVYHPLLT